MRALPWRYLSALLAAIASLGWRALPARADTLLDVQPGWELQSRASRWTPFVITASDPTPRNVVIELSAPHDSANRMTIYQTMALSPEPTTIALYAPVAYNGDAGLKVSVRDVRNSSVLAQWNAMDFPAMYSTQFFVPAESHFIAVSGRQKVLTVMEGRPPEEASAVVRFAPQRLLPYAAVGYDAIDLLVLNAPDFTQLDIQQQQALADWVRGGGTLVFWPGDGPLPASGPLIDILPAQVGEAQNLNLAASDLEAAGLPARFAALAVRRLTPRADARELALFEGVAQPTGYRSRVGFGQVLMAPLDLGLLTFSGTDAARKFWDRLLTPLFVDHPTRKKDGSLQWRGRTERDLAEMQAIIPLTNLLGDVPGAGQFDFMYVVIVMVALMLLVGPIDYFVLRRAGRQNWTWATTALWITVITTGALLLGYWIKSGDLHFRTVRFIDQADGQTVSTTDVFGIYSPRNDEYAVEGPAEPWWEPVTSDPSGYGYSSTLSNSWKFFQSYRDNQLLPLPVNVWNLAFARTKKFGGGAEALTAALRYETGFDAQHPHIAGKIANRGDLPIVQVMILTGQHYGRLDWSAAPLAPGEERDLNIESWPLPKLSGDEPLMSGFYFNYNAPQRELLPALGEMPSAVAGLSGLAATQSQLLLKERNDLACVLALSEVSQPRLKLKDRQPIERHWQIVRALAPLQNQPPSPATQPQ